MREFDYQPATDAELGDLERFASPRREAGLASALLHRASRATLRGYLRLAHRLEVQDAQHLPDEPPCVVVANHASHLDAPTLAAALPNHWHGRLYTLAARDTFFRSTQQAALAALLLNALPVDRSRGQRQGIQALRDKLVPPCASGSNATPSQALILFPEGTRSADGTLQAFRPGLGLLVAGTAVPVVPALLSGTFQAWPRHRRFPTPRRKPLIRVRFGPPLHFPDHRPNRAGCNAIAQACHDAVAQLAPADTPPPTKP